MKRANYKQFIADVYHCSETWGKPVTENDMRTDLSNGTRQKAKTIIVRPYLFSKSALHIGMSYAYCTRTKTINIYRKSVPNPYPI